MDSLLKKKAAKSTKSEKEVVSRLTRKGEAKAFYKDPNTTFKPEISKTSNKMMRDKQRNAFDQLTKDSKQRQAKAKQDLNRKADPVLVKAQEKSMKIIYKKFKDDFEIGLEGSSVHDKASLVTLLANMGYIEDD